jgi:ligand-binding sensor domain-containing protein
LQQGWQQMMKRVSHTIGFALFAALQAMPLAAQSRSWTLEDRVLVGNGDIVLALALGTREVYGATPTGIIVYDFTTERWKPPFAPVEGYPAQDEVTALAWDRVAGGLWVGTRAGDLYSWTPGFGGWDRHPLGAQSEVLAMAADAATGAVYVATARQWLRVQTGSSFAEPITPNDVPPDARRILDRTRERDPVLESLRGTLGLDADLRRWPITDVIEGERPGEFWVATAGGGIVHVDGRGIDREWLRFGLLTTGTAAIGFDGTNVWFGGDGRGQRNGVVAADPSLAQWWQVDAATEGGPAGFVAEIMTDSAATWFAASDGLYRLSGEPGEWDGVVYRTRDGLPSDEITSLARTGTRLWIGTRRGIAAIDERGRVETNFAGAPVHRLTSRNDTLWIAGDDGLWVIPAASSSLRRATAEAAPLAQQHAALSGRISDVATATDAVFVLIGDVLYTLTGEGWSGPLRDASLDAIGPPLRLATAEGRLWVAGGRGVAHRDPESGAWRAFEIPGDIPVGPVLDVKPLGEYVWIATPAGALRLRWK